MRLDKQQINELPQRQRAALVNSLSGFKPANLIGTADDHGHTNLAIMSSVVHLGSHPPLLALVVRPGGEDRHTLSNLLRSGQYSINHVGEDMVERAHQSAARYPSEVSEFDATGLTPAWWPGFSAPLVSEAPVKLAMQLREHRELEINGTHLVIGEVVCAELPDDSLYEDGSLDFGVTGSVALSGLDSYYRPALLKRMAYAKPDLPPRVLDKDPDALPSELAPCIARLLATQVQCVLSTAVANTSSQHLMAYAFEPALGSVFIASLAHTEKVQNMLANPQVSLLWDNRTGNTGDHTEGLALMGQGQATPVQGWLRARAQHLLLARNPQLCELLSNPAAQVFAVAIDNYRLARGYGAVETYHPQAHTESLSA